MFIAFLKRKHITHKKFPEAQMAALNKRILYFSILISIFLAGNASAGTYTMISLYTDIPNILNHCDCPDLPAPMFQAAFTDSGSDNSTDNSTGSASSGSLTLDVEGRSFDNETGSYLSYGTFFTGSWTASEYDYEANRYYDNVSQTIYINYSFFFVGMFLFDDTMVIGSFFTSTGTTISDPKSGTVLFFGIMISDT